MPQNFLVGLVAVAVGEALYVHTFAILVAKVLDHLHRAVRMRIVLDEAADEADDHGARHRAMLNWSDGLPALLILADAIADGRERQEEEDQPDEGTRTAHDRN